MRRVAFTQSEPRALSRSFGVPTFGRPHCSSRWTPQTAVSRRRPDDVRWSLGDEGCSPHNQSDGDAHVHGGRRLHGYLTARDNRGGVSRRPRSGWYAGNTPPVPVILAYAEHLFHVSGHHVDGAFHDTQTASCRLALSWRVSCITLTRRIGERRILIRISADAWQSHCLCRSSPEDLDATGP